MGAYGAPFTHSCLLTKLCSAARVLARDFEKAERIFYGGNWKFVVFFFPSLGDAASPHGLFIPI